MVKDLCFEIIETCPNRCRFCSSNSSLERNRSISFTDFKRVIDYFISKGGIKELSLSGGEPFLHPDLEKMIEYAKKYNIRTVIFTSGVKKRIPISDEEIKSCLEEMNKELESIEKYEPWNDRAKQNIRKFYDRVINPSDSSCITKNELNRLKNLGLDKIVFDYQAHVKETDSYLMGRDNEKYNCLLDSMLNASFVGLEIDVHFVPMKPNYKEITDILEMLEIAKINNISILNFVPQGRGLKNKDNLMLTKEELQDFMILLDISRNIYSGNIRVGIPLLENNTHKCNAGLEKLDIKFDGTILPCPAFKELDLETMNKFGIKHYNIYENLEQVTTPGGTRVEPLCKKIYGQKYNN